MAMAAGIATLTALKNRAVYVKLERLTAHLVEGLLEAANIAGVPVQINRVGSMFTVFFTSLPVTDYQTARASDTDRYGGFFRAMLERGVYFPPSQFEACFVSVAHTLKDMDATIKAAREAFTTE
jgi:glutamate-1-semialdehyde 2,1-aminomutase